MKKSNGFTLIELFMVMAILTITSILFLVNTGSVGAVKADSALWRIQSDVRYAHQLSVSTGRNHGVFFMENGGYTVYDSYIANAVKNPETNKSMTTNLPGISFTKSFMVEFDSLGSPVVGGGDNIELMTDSGETHRLYVVANTGAVVFNEPVHATDE